MSDLPQVLNAFRQASRRGVSAVLATVVEVQGSGYRRPGARLLVVEGEAPIGSISGGCLERDLAGRAFWLTESGAPVVQTYDGADDDDGFGWGTGCDGAITVLVEAVRPDDPTMAFLQRCLEARTPCVLATVYRADDVAGVAPGDRLMLDADGRGHGAIARPDLAASLAPAMEESLIDGRSVSHFCALQDGDVEVFIEAVRPPRPLVVFGAEPDAQPLVALAKSLGWHVTVVDPRRSPSTPRRFAAADAVLLDDTLAIGEDTFAVLMAHQYEHDKAMLHRLLYSPAAYIGLLGPAYRTDRMVAELEAESGEAVPPAQRRRVHAPVGLDLGGDGPQAIALAIMAEVQAVASGRAGGFLRDRLGPIHDRGAP